MLPFIAGIAVGAAVGMAFNNKKVKDKVLEVSEIVKDEAIKAYDSSKNVASDIKDKAKDFIDKKSSKKEVKVEEKEVKADE